MADLRFSECDPLVAETTVRDGDVIASPNPLHRPAETYQLDAHGFVRGPLSVEETCCTDGTWVRLPSDDASYVISFPVRGAMLAVHRGRELDLDPELQWCPSHPPSW
jgi:hypothetical protein